MKVQVESLCGEGLATNSEQVPFHCIVTCQKDELTAWVSLVLAAIPHKAPDPNIINRKAKISTYEFERMQTLLLLLLSLHSDMPQDLHDLFSVCCLQTCSPCVSPLTSIFFRTWSPWLISFIRCKFSLKPLWHLLEEGPIQIWPQLLNSQWNDVPFDCFAAPLLGYISLMHTQGQRFRSWRMNLKQGSHPKGQATPCDWVFQSGKTLYLSQLLF